MSNRVDLGDVYEDVADGLMERAKSAAADEAKILVWSADHARKAALKWASGDVDFETWQDWTEIIIGVRLPTQTAALAKVEAREALQNFIGDIFKGVLSLIGLRKA